jgi:hypothetical protein
MIPTNGGSAMIHRDPRCVFVTDKPGLADVVVVWLGEEGIAAQVMNPATLGGLEGLTPWSWSGVSARGIEVWVNDPEQASQALQLLAEQAEFQTNKADEAAKEQGPIEVVCEECGKATLFAGSQHGSVESCPQCGAYLDVLDPAEEHADFDEADVPEDEENQEPERP